MSEVNHFRRMAAIWRQASGATDMVLVMPGDLDLEQSIGGLVVGDFFAGQQRD